MPVEFFTEEQQRRYGRYTEEPSPLQLARYFHFDDRDQQLIAQRRGPHNRLGFALQLGTVRFLGTLLPDPTDIPAPVVTYVAHQLGIRDPTGLAQYREGATHWDHAAEIQRQYGYRDFHTPSEIFRLVRWLYTRAWLSAERPSVLFDLTTARLVERKVLLPGVTVLARLVARVRDRTAARLWRLLAALPTPAQRARLDTLVQVPEGAHQNPLDRLRRAPIRVSGPGLVQALRRLETLRALGVSHVPLTSIPPSRLKALARYAAAARAQAIARMPDDRRMATLLAFAVTFETTALDDALDLFDRLMTDLIRDAALTGQKARLRTLRDLDAAALQLQEACQMLLDPRIADAAVRACVFTQIPRESLVEAATRVHTLTRPPDDHYYPELVERYQSVQRFFPALLRTVTFHGTPAGQPVLEALHFLAPPTRQRPPDLQHAPLEVVPRAWRRVMLDTHKQVDRRAYTRCIVQRLQESLRRRDVFVTPSERWGDPRVKLLQGPQWDAMRPQVCRALGHPETAAPALEALTHQLDAPTGAPWSTCPPTRRSVWNARKDAIPSRSPGSISWRTPRA
jgi:uncharacterized protein DUF4158